MKKRYLYPAVTVDVVLISFNGKQLKVLLIQRKNRPFKDFWAFPGGFIGLKEKLVESALRELAEETNIVLKPEELIQFYTAGDPGRDPRGRTISVVFLALKRFKNLRPKAADDAHAIGWFDIYSPPPLAFDHSEILKKAIIFLREKFVLHPVDISKSLLPKDFISTDVKRLVAQIFNQQIRPGFSQHKLKTKISSKFSRDNS